jgi:hypothetical protein
MIIQMLWLGDAPQKTYSRCELEFDILNTQGLRRDLGRCFVNKNATIAATIAILFSNIGFAQAVAGLGAISGVVRDASGAGVPDAQVVVANPSKGIRRNLTSNEAGVFSASSLVPSTGYLVTVTKPGFAEFQARNVEILVGQNVNLEVVLNVAGTTTTIEVEAAAPVVESTKTDVSVVVNSAQILNLPINGRRVDSFVLLAPAVVPDGTFGLVSFRGIAGGNSFLTDGNDTTNQFYNENAGRTRITTQISQDAVQEFQVLSDGYSAEFGRASGGVINTVTRGGSNDLHGTAYWFFRNQDFNARDPFATINPDETRHQAGASLGGKLIKDKFFYFFNGETTRRDFPLFSSLTLPPFFDANGRFVSVQPDGRPTCGPPATPEQCTAAIRFLDREFRILDRTANSELGFGKLDWRPNERNSFSASFNYLRWLSPNGIQTQAVLNNGNGVGNNANSTVRARYGRFAWTAIPTATAVNEFRFGWFKDKQFDYVNDELALPGIGLLGITVQGQRNLGTAIDYPRLNPSENRYQFADSLTWTKGKHTWKFGTDIMSTEDYNDILRNRAGSYTYPTFTSFAQDLTGNTTGAKRWQNYSQRFGNSVADLTIRDYSFYAQDQYRLTANLTFNYGLRYDYSQLPQPTLVNPDYPATGGIPSAKKNFAPRAGVAYAFNKSRTVLRGGYGIFYARYQGGLINTFFLENGVYQKEITFNASFPADLANGPVFPNRLPNDGRPAPPGTVDVTFASQDLRDPYTQQGNIAIEHEIGKNLGFTASYIWSRGVHLTTVQDINVGPLGPVVTYRINDVNGNQAGAYTTPTYRRANRVDPRWNRVNAVDSGGNSYYNALALQLRKRLSHGIEGSMAYTWAHAIDYSQGGGNNNIFFSGGPSTVFNGDYRGEKGSSQLDQRHRLAISTIWSPTFTKSTGAFARYLVNNWQLSQISTFASAPAATGTINVSGAPFTGAAFNGSLNGLGGSSRVPFYPLSSLDIDRIARTDARLSKVLAFSDRFKLYLNFEAFNILNHTYFTSVINRAFDARTGVLTPSPRYGDGSATQGFPDGTNARRAQVSARFMF